MADETEKTTEGGKSGGKITKVVAVVFGAIVAPIIVAVVAKWADPALWKNTAPAPPTTAAAANPSTPSDKQTKPSESTTAKQPPTPALTYKLKELRRFTEKGHTNNVLAVAISPDGKRILSGGYDRTVRLWDTSGGPPLKVLQEPEQETIWHVAFLPDGRRALTGGGDVWKNGAEVEGSDFQVRMWDLETGKVVRRFKNHTKKVYDLALSADGRTMLTGSMDTTVRLWDVESGREIMTFQQPQKRRVWSTALTADGRLGLSGDGDGEVHLWDIAKRTGTPMPANNTHVLAVAFAPDGKRALTGAVGHIMRLWDVDSTKQVAQFQHPTGISSLTFSPNGQLVASASGWRLLKASGFVVPARRDQRVHLFNVKDVHVGDKIPEPAQSQDFEYPPTTVVFSPDGRYLVCGGETVHLLEIKEETGKK